jgi:DNA-binding NarL/FixJ family response regulator
MNASQSLTTREAEIAGLVGDGLSIHVVAERLGLAQDTVKTHLRRVYAKLGVHNRSQLTRILLESRRITRTGDRRRSGTDRE